MVALRSTFSPKLIEEAAPGGVTQRFTSNQRFQQMDVPGTRFSCCGLVATIQGGFPPIAAQEAAAPGNSCFRDPALMGLTQPSTSPLVKQMSVLGDRPGWRQLPVAAGTGCGQLRKSLWLPEFPFSLI